MLFKLTSTPEWLPSYLQCPVRGVADGTFGSDSRCPGRDAQIPFSSSWLPDEWWRRPGKVTNAQRKRRLAGVNCRLRVVTRRERGTEIAFRTSNVGIGAQPLLVRFKHRVEGALRSRQQLFGGVLLFQRGLI